MIQKMKCCIFKKKFISKSFFALDFKESIFKRT